MPTSNAFETLKNIGFTEYEARAYSALLLVSPANGYQVAQHSGIPRSKVYETLERLVLRGAAVPVEMADEKMKYYAPTAPDELIEGIERENKAACQKAREAMKQVQSDPKVVEVLWRVNSQDSLISRGKELAEEARETLHVALWPSEFDEMAEDLEKAARRGINIALILYGPHRRLARIQKLGVGAVQHGRSKHQAIPSMGRQFVLVSDMKRCITGSIFSDLEVDGVFTMNKGLVTNAVDLVNHEIYVERILEEVGQPVWDVFGRNLNGLESFDPPKPKKKKPRKRSDST